MSIDHDLNHDELKFLVSRLRSGNNLWYWVRTPDSKERIVNPRLKVEDGQIISVSADSNHSDAMIIRSIYQARVRRYERRSKASRKAGVARSKRMERLVYAAATALKENRLRPRSNCMVCGRGLADDDSISRGIGSECWQRVLNALDAEVTV